MNKKYPLYFPILFVLLGSTAFAQGVQVETLSPSAVLPTATGSHPSESQALVPLSEAIKTELAGVSLNAAQDQKLKKQALEYLDFKHGRMPSSQKLRWLAGCLTRSKDNFFCGWIEERQQRREAREALAANADARPAEPATSKTVEDITQGRIKELAQVSSSSLHRAMKKISDWSSLKSIVDQAMQGPACPSTALLTTLGQKAEEYFPEQSYRKIAATLYSRANLCGSEDDDSAVKARYRLSLLHIWADRCVDAEPLLARLSTQKSSDYAARSLYWRATCAKNSGNKLLAAAMQGKLRNDYPLSYHSLLTEQASEEKLGITAARILDDADPLILIKSELQPSLNAAIRAAEMLQLLGANDLALEILDLLPSRLETAEPEFRLYVVYLMSRSGFSIGRYKILNGLFRDHSSMISRASLKYFYPLHRFEDIKRFSEKVDPYLVSALIRQESGFNDRARSGVGAVGLMQLMPATARRLERVSRRQLLDPKTNIRVGIRFFCNLLDRYNSDAELALAAYNAGPEKVDAWVKRYPTSNRMLFLDLVPFKETREYVSLIARNYFWYMSLYQPMSATRVGTDKLETARNPASTKKPLVFTLFSAVEKQKQYSN